MGGGENRGDQISYETDVLKIRICGNCQLSDRCFDVPPTHLEILIESENWELPGGASGLASSTLAET